MLGELTTFLLGMLLAGNASKDLFTFHTEKMTWMEARTVCSRDGGSLTSNYNQENFNDLITNVTDPVWIGNYYSPWAWLLGCYNYTQPRDYIEVKANQMKECLNHCYKTNYFGLQNNKCFCFDKFEGSPLVTSRACKYECPGNSDERCGGKNAITIYMNDICYENSAEWQGTISQTKNGKQCLPWASIEEVKKRRVKYFPDGNAENASNFCRNPIGKSYRPWCYFSETYWQVCDIPPCIKEAEDGIYPCMSFKKPKYENFQFTQEDCQNEHFAICTSDNFVDLDHNEGTWEYARHQSREYYNNNTFKQCESLAGPQIFWLGGKFDVQNSTWIAFFREVCSDSDTVPNKMPTECFSLSKNKRNNDLKVEDCDNKNHFICQYIAVTCGVTFTNTVNGSFETPGYNTSFGYGDFQRCVWTITVPENHYITVFLNILIEDTYKCNSDVLKVFEDRYETGVSFCGKSKETFNTTGNHVTIEFKSDGTVNHYRGVQVKWYAAEQVSSVTTQATKKTTIQKAHVDAESNNNTLEAEQASSVTTQATKKTTIQKAHVDAESDNNTLAAEQASSVTTQATKKTTIQKAHVDAESDNNTLAGGALVGIIVGILVGFCLVLGTVLFWVKRKKKLKSSERAVQSELDSGTNYENVTSRHSGRWNSDNNTRHLSKIYQNAVTENENLDISLSNSVVHEAALTNAADINSVSVVYQKPSDTDDCDHQSGGNSDVYNTLLIYQNPTENVYSALNNS